MKNDLIVILSTRRKTVADVHEATGISLETIADIYYERVDSIDIQTIVKICDYLNITLGEFLGRKIRPVRNQVGQNVMFNESILKIFK